MQIIKYHNKKTLYDDIKFDSIKEKNRYVELKLLERAGEIKDLILQQKFILQDSFKYQDKTERAITYSVDFSYYECESNLHVVEDVKGYRKAGNYPIKRKLFLFKYGDVYDFREV